MKLVISFALVVLACACGGSEPACDDGEILLEDGTCMPGGGTDGGPDGSHDAGSDGGPCGTCADGLVCDEARGECVECLGASECTEAGASRCAGGTCLACMTNADCAHIDGLGVCDGGECVECSSSDATACGTNPCTSMRTCSEYGTAQLACQACDTDDNCMGANDYCVPLDYMGADRGGYCLTDVDLAGGCEQPFSITIMDRTTLSGRTGARYCGINEALATCEAVRALIGNQTCPGGMDGECPESGLCRTVGTLANRCTYGCGGAVECDDPPRPGNTCGPGTTGGDDYCGG